MWNIIIVNELWVERVLRRSLQTVRHTYSSEHNNCQWMHNSQALPSKHRFMDIYENFPKWSNCWHETKKSLFNSAAVKQCGITHSKMIGTTTLAQPEHSQIFQDPTCCKGTQEGGEDRSIRIHLVNCHCAHKTVHIPGKSIERYNNSGMLESIRTLQTYAVKCLGSLQEHNRRRFIVRGGEQVAEVCSLFTCDRQTLTGERFSISSGLIRSAGRTATKAASRTGKTKPVTQQRWWIAKNCICASPRLNGHYSSIKESRPLCLRLIDQREMTRKAEDKKKAGPLNPKAW